MLGRVALEHHAWRPPRLLALKIAQAPAATRTECHGIVEDLPDLGVPRGGIGAVLVEPYDRSGLPQNFVCRMRVAQEIERERIDLANRNPIGWAPCRRGLRHDGVSSNEPGCKRRYYRAHRACNPAAPATLLFKLGAGRAALAQPADSCGGRRPRSRAT